MPDQHTSNDGVLQVRNLRPGRRYAFRLVCIPVVPPELTAPASQPTSPPVAFANPATVPGAPQPPRLGGRGRTNLTVGVELRWVADMPHCQVVTYNDSCTVSVGGA